LDLASDLATLAIVVSIPESGFCLFGRLLSSPSPALARCFNP